MLKYILCSALLYLTCIAVGFAGGIEYMRLFSDNCMTYKTGDSPYEKVSSGDIHRHGNNQL
jgi:hypothetical protein